MLVMKYNMKKKSRTVYVVVTVPIVDPAALARLLRPPPAASSVTATMLGVPLRKT